MTSRYAAHFFNIGQGQASAVIDRLAGEAMIVDCAPQSLKKFRDLDCNYRLVVVTHLDFDHCGDLARVVEHLQPEKVLLNFDTAWPGRRKDKRLLSILQKLEAWRQEHPPALSAPIGPATEDAVPNGVPVGGLDWQILGPQHADVGTAHLRQNRNIASAILTVRLSDRTILYTGDAPARTLQAAMTRNPRALVADIVVVPHHAGECGWPTDLDEENFYRHVGAEIAIVSVGSRNNYKHPRPRTIPVVDVSSTVMCTQVTNRCMQAPATDTGGPMTAAVPCADDICVEINAAGGAWTLTPDPATHHKTVTSWPHPLCRPASTTKPTPAAPASTSAAQTTD